MATSEDLVNRLFVNPLDSIGRKLRSGRRRHTTDVVPGLSFRSAKSEQSDKHLPKSRHTSVDFGSSVIPVEIIADAEVCIFINYIFFCLTCIYNIHDSSGPATQCYD